MSYFDELDAKLAREKPAKPIELEPAEEGDCCPDPDCGGVLHIGTFGAGSGSYLQLACPKCGSRFGESCP